MKSQNNNSHGILYVKIQLKLNYSINPDAYFHWDVQKD